MNMMTMSIGKRLTIGFGVVIALLILLAALSSIRIGGLAAQVNQVVNDRYPKTVLANKLKIELNEMTRSMLSVLIMTDPGQIKAELQIIEAKNASSNAALKTLQQTITDPTGLDLLKKITTERDKFLPVQASFVSLINEDKKDDAMVKFMFALRPKQTKYYDVLDKFIAYQNKEMDVAGQDSASTAERTKWFILILALAAAGLSLAVAYGSTHSITVPLRQAVRIAKKSGRWRFDQQNRSAYRG